MKPIQPNKQSFIYQIEVLVDAERHDIALEQLIHQLNLAKFTDYKVLSGIQLGSEIEARRQNATETTAIPTELPVATEKLDAVTKKQETAAHKIDNEGSFAQVHRLMKENALIRLIVNKGLGIRLDIPCRIIHLNEVELLLTVYHVDEKQVYTFRLNEIEDYSSFG